MRGLELRPPWNLLGAALCFVALDALIFKSGLYQRVSSPESAAGAVESFTRFELLRQRTGLEEALVIGECTVSEGLSPAAVEAAFPNAPLRVIDAGLGELSPRAMAYLLRKLDPDRNRYRMIVLPLHSYDASPEFTLIPDDDDDSEMLGAVIGFRDYLEFSLSLSGFSAKTRALARGLIGSVHYAKDFQDLLGNPAKRLRVVRWYNELADRVEYTYTGRPETMLGLALDPTTGTTSFPDRLTPEQRTKYAHFLKPRPTVEGPDGLWPMTRQVAASMHDWLGSIVSSYRGQNTLVVFLSMPEGPIKLPLIEPPPGAPSVVDEFKGEPHVVIVDRQVFQFLEKPQYFWDMRRLNTAGRVEFSRTLMEVLLRVRESHSIPQ